MSPKSLIAFTILPMTWLGVSQAEPVPAFSLEDVNPNSVRHGQVVAPHDYRLQVSAYYFGAAG